MAEKQFPPEGFVPTRSAVEGIVVYMPAPIIDDYEKRVEFACPNCGGVQAYNVSDGGLSCTSCGYYQQPDSVRVGHRAKVNEFRTEESERRKQERLESNARSSLATAAAAAAESASAAGDASTNAELSSVDTENAVSRPSRLKPSSIGKAPASDDYDWGAVRQELECTNCGASILLDPKSLTHVCPFCGSSSVVQHAFDHDKMRPRYLIPFTVETESALNTIKHWLGNSWMTPSDLQQRAGLNELTGIYLPYWTFSAFCSANWRAQVGHTRTRRDKDGKTETYTVWKWENGQVQFPIRDLLVPGTAKLNQRLLNELDQFNMGSLVEYSVDYLAGFNAQTYDIGLDNAWTHGRELMREQTKSACYRQASTGKVRNFSMNLDYADETWRYVLLPVYLITYRYEEESFTAMVNGQSGHITGQRPVEWSKVWMAMVASMIPAILTALTALLFFEGENAETALTVAGILALIGVAIIIFLAFSALNVRKAS